MAAKKTVKKTAAKASKTASAPKNATVTVKDIAEELQMHPKALRRRLRNDSRSDEGVSYKEISRATRYAFTPAQAKEIVKRFSKSA